MSVLQELENKQSDAYVIAHARNLPIYSTTQEKWFGVSGINLTHTIPRVEGEGAQYFVRLLKEFLKKDDSNDVVQMNGTSFMLAAGADAFHAYKTKLCLDNNTSYQNCLYIAALYPRKAQLGWDVRGGDLLYACGVLFALLKDTNYMYVEEGPHMLTFEQHWSDYKYYNKFILGPAAPVTHREASNEETEQEIKQNTSACYVKLLSSETNMQNVSEWLWMKMQSTD